MEKYLITGFSGFVARYFLDYLEKNMIESSILGLDVNPPHFIDKVIYKYVKWDFAEIDLLNKGE